MILETILRAAAATYLNTSATVLTDAELLQYMISKVDYNYPNLHTNNPDLYAKLTQLSSLTDINSYQWWFNSPVGPKSCSRDIGDCREMLKCGKGDEWGEDIEAYILEYQKSFHDDTLVTGYVCNETLRRLRL